MVKVTGLSLLPMEAASVRERSSLRLSPGRVAAVLVGLTLAAWILTFDRMRGMDAGPGVDLGGLGCSSAQPGRPTGSSRTACSA
jgi:hypothetical protein